MENLLSIYHAFASANIEALSNPSILITLYCVLFSVLLLENGILPAAFLPGDSLLLFTGLLISQDVLHFGWVNLVMILGAVIGTWLGYLQGIWLGNTKLVQGWIAHLPKKYYDKTQILFHKYGLQALFIGRFIPFVRTAMPIMAGISGLHSKKFHIYNLISATLWIFLIVTVGYLIGLTPIFSAHKDLLLKLFALIPIVLLVIGLISSIVLVVKRKYGKKNSNTELK